ncbi:MAG TPA: ABC transporter permease, partial [Clostridia bacterium]|nr:ABC transporter permease [Clostridia bacterium]
MRTFLTVLKNNYLRTVPRAIPVLVMTIITLASIMLAVYITGIQQVKGHIVFVTQSPTAVMSKSSKLLEITVSAHKPPHSDLVKQKYDAYITVDDAGNYQIETLHSNDFKNMLLLLLKHPDAKVGDSKTDRGVGVNIIGFMMMFLLMLAFSNLFAFADDKEQGQLHRIATAPASFGFYLAAHCIYCLSFLLPEFLLLAVLKLIGWNIGFTLLQYAGLMAVLGFLGISFALLLNTLIQKPDNANMLGNSITVLTSVLAGSFYSFSKNNALLDNIIKLLPQKEIMDFAQHMQGGSGWQHSGSIIYTIAFS